MSYEEVRRHFPGNTDRLARVIYQAVLDRLAREDAEAAQQPTVYDADESPDAK